VIQIDQLNLENKEPIHGTRANHAMHSTIVQLSVCMSLSLSLSIYIYI
jgi:hypothetical protein